MQPPRLERRRQSQVITRSHDNFGLFVAVAGLMGQSGEINLSPSSSPKSNPSCAMTTTTTKFRVGLRSLL
jgi:hypothetical protein